LLKLFLSHDLGLFSHSKKNIQMKKLLFILSMLNVTSLFAVDRFVDAAFGSGNGTTMFPTITSAITAASNGDRILIATGIYSEGAITISKSLSLIPQTPGAYITYNGNITIAGTAGMKLYFVGFRMGIYGFSASSISGGSITNRALVSFVDCKMGDLSINADFYELLAVRTSVTNTTTMRYGSFIASKTNDIAIVDETGANNTTDKIRLIADSIMNNFEMRADNYCLSVYNCLMKNIKFYKWNYVTASANEFFNNDVITGANWMLASQSVPGYNFKFSSNNFLGTINFNSGGTYSGYPYYTYGYYWDTTVDAGLQYSASTSLFPTANSSGYFEWTYNGVDIPCTAPTASNPLVLTRILGTTGTTVNTANPNHEFYDIDLTVGDRGRFGGPYTWNNYFPVSNPSGSRAFIYDLSIPADLFPGQNVDVKAKAYHRN
jgi:hypothetical protein